MGTLWQFFGFPDPESPSPEASKQNKKKVKDAKESTGQQLTLVSPDDAVESSSENQEGSPLDAKEEPTDKIK